MKYLLYILIIPFALSCKNSESTANNKNDKVQKNKQDSIQNMNYFTEDSSLVDLGVKMGSLAGVVSDNVTIKKATVREGRLLLKITYSGGCQQHGFGIVANPNIMKSMPPQRNIAIKHMGHEDMCKAFFRKTISFDIKDLLPDGYEEIILKLKNWKGSLHLKSSAQY